MAARPSTRSRPRRGGGALPQVPLYTRSLALNTGVPRSDVEDIVAETWARILASLDAGGGPVTNFGGYLASTVHHVSVDHWRKHRRITPIGDVEDILTTTGTTPDRAVPGPGDAVDQDDAELVAAARAALNRLSPTQRRLLAASLADGYRNARQAQEDGTTPAALANRLTRARKALRRNYLPPD